MLYFGCWSKDHIGHFLRNTEGKMMSYSDTPWGTGVDGRIQPGGHNQTIERQIQGQCTLSHKDGWTAIAFWDRSADYRGASCSAFITMGTLCFEEMVTLARSAWPHIFKRLDEAGIELRKAEP